MQKSHLLSRAADTRLLSLLEQTSVLSDYRATIADDSVSADTLFHESKPGEPPIVIPLHQHLYERFYCRLDQTGAGTDASKGSETENLQSPAEFLEELRSANTGREISRSEWMLHSFTASGQAFVTCGETIHLAEAGDFSLRQQDDSTPPAIESVLFRKERISRETGFYFGMGETPADAFDRTLVSRFYFNLPASQAAEWFRQITTIFNRGQMPYTMKCPMLPQAFERSDSCVLYVPRRYLQMVLCLLPPVLQRLRQHLRSEVPMFSRPLIPGVGFGDDPGTGESFGQHRMRLVARGLCQAQQNGATTSLQKREHVAQQFAAHGLNLDAAHLSPGAVDILDTFSFEVNTL